MSTFPANTAAPLAGHGRRLAAVLLDAVAYCLVVGACGGLGLVAGLIRGSSADDTGDGWKELEWIVLGTVVGLAIGVVCWVVLVVWVARRPGERNGQTIGKQLVGIRTMRIGGAPLDVGAALLREVLAKGLLVGMTSSLISGFLGFADAGVIGFAVAIAVWYGPALVDDERRALHDRMLGTRVVDAKAVAAPPAPADELWPATP